MWRMFKIALLLEVVLGVRRVEKRSRGPTNVIAASPVDSEGHWNATVEAGLFHSVKVHLESPDGKEYNFDTWAESNDIGTLTRTRTLMPQESVLHGFDGEAELTAVETNGAIAGSIVDPDTGMVHQFIGEEGELEFTSTPSSDFPDEAEPLEDDELEQEEALVESNNSVSDGSVIDVMVLWTKDAECINAGRSWPCSLSSSTLRKMRAKIALAIQETNDAYTRSKIFTKLRLVHTYREMNYKEKGVGMSTTLARLTSTNDDYMKGVHRKRQEHKADVVAFIVGTGDACGMAYYGPNKARAFSVTKLSCATGYYSFGHEIGHNMGCRHDRGTMKACSSRYSYYGWRDPNAKWRDILSYACKSDDCMKQKAGYCTRMKFFANPNLKYRNQPTGKAGKADLAKQINAVKAKMANFY